MIFVFGSNLLGYHGAGAAFVAHKMGHPWGHGAGYWDKSRTYALPTKANPSTPLELKIVDLYVQQLMYHAVLDDLGEFKVTRVGCGLAGFKDESIAPMFGMRLKDTYDWKFSFDEAWRPWLPANARYWGTYP